MAKIDITYHKLLNEILNNGYWYKDPNREGVKRLEIPSYTFRHEFKDGFPAITTKKLNYKNVVTELLFFLKGETNIKYLIDNNCNIWSKDAYNYYKNKVEKDENLQLSFKEFLRYIKDTGEEYSIKSLQYKFGDLGNVYGYYWRNFDGIDQISDLIKNLKEKPLGTEHIVTSRHPKDKEHQALPCCHYAFQIVVRPLNITEQVEELRKYQHSPVSAKDLEDKGIKYGFELHWSQRSVDTFLGLPYNIASYATLALIIEKLTGYKVLGIQGDLKKVHLYDNSINAVRKQLNRSTTKYSRCELKIIPDIENTTETVNDLFDILEPEDFELGNYQSYPHIKVEMLERNK